MDVNSSQLAVGLGVSERTARRWMARLYRLYPWLVRRAASAGGHTYYADAKKLKRYLPTARKPVMTRAQLDKMREDLDELTRRHDVEVKERLALHHRLERLESAVMGGQSRARHD